MKESPTPANGAGVRPGKGAAWGPLRARQPRRGLPLADDQRGEPGRPSPGIDKEPPPATANGEPGNLPRQRRETPTDTGNRARLPLADGAPAAIG